METAELILTAAGALAALYGAWESRKCRKEQEKRRELPAAADTQEEAMHRGFLNLMSYGIEKEEQA